MTPEDIREISKQVFEKISSNEPSLVKEAENAINDFIRKKVRETSFYHRIMPPLRIQNSELDRSVTHDKPMKIIDIEPDSPAAATIPFATLPSNLYIRANKFPVMMSRIVTRRYQKDVDELRTYHMDVRQIISDNSVKDMDAEDDTKFIQAVDNMLLGEGVTHPASGIAQYQKISGGINRDNLWEGLTVMPSTPFSLEVKTSLINHITAKHYAKLDRIEQGGDLAEKIMRDGWAEENYNGHRYIVTIKKGLVPLLHQYQFADEKFIGRHLELEPTTMYIRREAFMIEFFAYKTAGGTLAHSGGLAHINYNN